LKKELVIFTDGACSGNPGEAAVGVVIKEDNKTIKEISQTIGEATNNIAEYTALIYALQEALLLKATHLKIFTDSELLYKQVTGQYKIKQGHIQALFDQIKHLRKGFEHIDISHVLRDRNKEADKLATDALKKSKKQAKVVAPDS
jgi:ribonuclease HI